MPYLLGLRIRQEQELEEIRDLENYGNLDRATEVVIGEILNHTNDLERTERRIRALLRLYWTDGFETGSNV